MIQLAWTELKLLFREPVTMLVAVLLPLFLMVLIVISYGENDHPAPEYGGLTGTDYYVPVYLSAAVVAMGLMGLPTHLATYRESGVLKRLRAAGVRSSSLIAAEVAVALAVTLTSAALMIAVGVTMFDVASPTSAGGVLGGLVVGSVAFSLIGVLLGALMPTARAAQGVGLVLFFGFFFLAGGGPPPAILPDLVNTIIGVTPVGPLVDAITQPWHPGGWSFYPLLWLSVAALVALGGSLAGFRRAQT